MSDAERIAKLEARVAELEKVITAFRAVFTGSASSEGASDRELDHPQYGDPEVKILPRDWTKGGVSKGQRFSRCPVDFLEVLAETLDYFEQKNRASGATTSSGKLKADFDKRQARLARGWARRLRDGWTPPAAPTFGGAAPSFGGETENPFAAPPRTWTRPVAKASRPPPSETAVEGDADSFNFGMNVKPPAGPRTVLIDDDDDDEDLPVRKAEAAE